MVSRRSGERFHYALHRRRIRSPRSPWRGAKDESARQSSRPVGCVGRRRIQGYRETKSKGCRQFQFYTRTLSLRPELLSESEASGGRTQESGGLFPWSGGETLDGPVAHEPG